MKKLSVLFLLPLLAFNFMVDWQLQQMDARASVEFPVKPVESEMSGNPIWIANIDDQNRCMAMVFDYAAVGMDSAQVANELSDPAALAVFRDQLLGEFDNAKVLSENSSVNNGHILFEYEIDRGGDTLELNHWYSKCYFVSTKMYVLNYFERSKTKDNPTRAKFFGSFKVK